LVGVFEAQSAHKTQIPPRSHGFRSASLNAMVHSTLPVESKTWISPDLKQGAVCAQSIA
jgi:hypothetical protein